MKIRPQKQAPQQPSVDLENAETMRCEKCDHPIFIQGYIVKKISAITSPTGKEVIAPVQVFNCGNCGHLLNLAGINELI